MKPYIILACIVLVWFLIGFLAGRYFNRKKIDGVIVIEMSEDNERECIRFVLNTDLDDIKTKKELLLKVENTLSQNSQAV